METSYLKTLELDKIIARAAEGCVCKEARAMLLAIEPQCDPDEVRYALEQTDAINTLLIKNGSPRFGGVEGVSQLAARAVKGGVLSMGELLMVAGALRNFQHLTSWYGSSEHDALPTDDLFYALAPEPGLEQQISSAILAPDAMADTASRTLAELRKKIRATENSIRDRLESMVRNMDTSKYLQESVVSMRNGRYVVPVKSEYRGEVSGMSVTLAPFEIPQSATLFGINSSLVLELPVMLLVMVLLTIPALVRGKLSRVQGVALLCIYAAFCAVQFTM